jgi:hypothetical protein
LPAAIGWLRTTSHTLAQRVSSSMHDRCEGFEYGKVLNGELEVGGWFVSCISILRKDGGLSTIPSSSSASRTPPSTLDTNSLSSTEYSQTPYFLFPQHPLHCVRTHAIPPASSPALPPQAPIVSPRQTPRPTYHAAASHKIVALPPGRSHQMQSTSETHWQPRVDPGRREDIGRVLGGTR